ncbi:MAG: gluconate 2-dehydrogenase subunit 3 family protein [Opitutaceae bacterium]|nr:gluconate 2-dehydrogenase subunit 3 family protein [Opitutaceae bacterium]
MNRREALRQGGRLATAAALWAGLPARTWAALAAVPGWSDAEEQLLTLLGDTILPATPGSPGAGSVGIGRFVLMMTAECHGPDVAVAVRQLVRDVEADCQAAHGRGFSALNPAEREAILVARERKAAEQAKGGRFDPFRHVKGLVLLGYFTSEPGATQALRYDPVPGTYRGSVTLGENERSWAL